MASRAFKQMNGNLKYWAAPIAGILLASLVGCGSVSPERSTNKLRESPTPSISPSPSSLPTTTPSPGASQNPSQPLNPAETIQNPLTVKIYRSDEQCQELIPESATVSATEPMVGAVSRVLDRWDTVDFNLIGYRVNVDSQTRIATVDLRLDPNSPRVFTSLSSCEQFDLFGSLRATLTSNDWDIDTVEFTSLGEEIEL